MKGNKSNICNLSKYARLYKDENGEKKGLMLSAFTGSKDGYEYTNIWLKKDEFGLKKNSDGTVTLSVKLLELEVKESKKEQDDDTPF